MFLFREIVGWSMVLLGLWAFWVTWSFLGETPAKIFQSGPMTVIGIVLFRGGLHLLKVATAARVTQLTEPPRAAAQVPRRAVTSSGIPRGGIPVRRTPAAPRR